MSLGRPKADTKTGKTYTVLDMLDDHVTDMHSGGGRWRGNVWCCLAKLCRHLQKRVSSSQNASSNTFASAGVANALALLTE